jgi:hypothetical protein
MVNSGTFSIPEDKGEPWALPRCFSPQSAPDVSFVLFLLEVLALVV